MRRETKTATEAEPEGHAFGAALARALESARTDAVERTRSEAAARVRLGELALAAGDAFYQAVQLEARAIAQGFNRELGAPRLAVRMDGRAVTVADTTLSAGYVELTLILPAIADESIEPYVRVSTTGGQTPWSFSAEGGALMVRRDRHADPLSPEAFVRAVVGPWLERLPMAPRVLVPSIPSALPRINQEIA